MRESLEDAVKSGDRRQALVAIRDYLAHELEGSRCHTCDMSRLRTGDQAGLVLRLTSVLEELEAMPDPNAAKSRLEDLRTRDASNVHELRPTAGA
ncbi:hypothetical protein [Streptomyces sp. NPDC001774]